MSEKPTRGDIPRRTNVPDWRQEASNNIAVACSSFAAGKYRQAIVLLDDAAGLVAQGHIAERKVVLASQQGRRPPSVPAYLAAMTSSASPPLPARERRVLQNLHEVRNILVHRIAERVEERREQCLEFLREVVRFAGHYGVSPPALVPIDLDLRDPISTLI